MKAIPLAIAGSLFALFNISASAAPYLYTFTGSISYIEADDEILDYVDFDNDLSTTSDTFTVSEPMEYTFLVDFDLPGFCSGPLGTTYSSTCTGANIPDSSTANYFFSDLVSATKLAQPTEEDTLFNFGLSISNLGWLVGDSAVFIISPYNIPVENWVASSSIITGTLVEGTDSWAAPNGNNPYGRIHSLLTLTSIVPVTMNKPDCDHHHDEDHSKYGMVHHDNRPVKTGQSYNDLEHSARAKSDGNKSSRKSDSKLEDSCGDKESEHGDSGVCDRMTGSSKGNEIMLMHKKGMTIYMDKNRHIARFSFDETTNVTAKESKSPHK